MKEITLFLVHVENNAYLCAQYELDIYTSLGHHLYGVPDNI